MSRKMTTRADAKKAGRASMDSPKAENNVKGSASSRSSLVINSLPISTTVNSPIPKRGRGRPPTKSQYVIKEESSEASNESLLPNSNGLHERTVIKSNGVDISSNHSPLEVSNGISFVKDSTNSLPSTTGLLSKIGIYLPWGGPFGVLLCSAMFTALPFETYLFATHPNNFLHNYSFSAVKSFKILINWTLPHFGRLEVYAGFYAYFLLQALFGIFPLIPFVTRISLQPTYSKNIVTYRCTGFARLLITGLCFTGLHLWDSAILASITDKWPLLMVISSLNSIILAPFLNARIGNFDLHLWAYETGAISFLVLDGLWLLQDFNNSIAQLLFGFHTLFIISSFFNEKYYIANDAFSIRFCGFLKPVFGLFLLPWFMSVPIFYATHHSLSCDLFSFHYLANSALFFLGLSLYWASLSSYQMYFHLPDPSSHINGKNSVQFDHGVPIPKGPYRWIRHPQTLSVFLMTLACTLSLGYSHLLAWAPFAFIVLWISHRVASLERCNSNTNWLLYKSHVYSLFIPYVI